MLIVADVRAQPLPRQNFEQRHRSAGNREHCAPASASGPSQLDHIDRYHLIQNRRVSGRLRSETQSPRTRPELTTSLWARTAGYWTPVPPSAVGLKSPSVFKTCSTSAAADRTQPKSDRSRAARPTRGRTRQEHFANGPVTSSSTARNPHQIAMSYIRGNTYHDTKLDVAQYLFCAIDPVLRSAFVLPFQKFPILGLFIYEYSQMRILI